MRPEMQEVRKIVEEIQDIEDEIRRLEEQKTRLQYRLEPLVVSRSMPATPSAVDVEVVVRGRTPSESSAKKLIVRLLNDNPETDFSAETVARNLSMNIGTVRTNLSRMVTKEHIAEKRSAHTYGALTKGSLREVQGKEAPLLEEAS